MEKSKISKIKNIILLGLLVAVASGTIFGFNIGISDPTWTSMELPGNKFGIKENESGKKALFSAAMVFGAFIGCPMFGTLADLIGRKLSLLIGFVIFGVGVLFTVIIPNFILLSFGRLIIGLSIGSFSSIGPVYLAETSPDDLRGFLGVFFQFAITFSIFLASLTNYFRHKLIGWRIMSIINGILGIPLLILAIIIPESPRFLIIKQKEGTEEKALKLLKEIYDDEEKAQQEVTLIKEKSSASSNWSDLLLKTNLKKLLLGVVLAVALQLTGINAIIIYSSQIVKDLDFSTNIKITIQVAIMAWNCLSSMISVLMISKLERRKMLLGGQILLIFSLGVSGVSYFIKSHNVPFAILFVSGVFMFIFAFEVSIGALFFVIMSEISPDNLRGRIGSLMNSVQWFFAFILTISFPSLDDALTNNGKNENGYVFFIFMGIGCLTWVYEFFFLPETTGKSMDEIEKLFDSKYDQKTEKTAKTEKEQENTEEEQVNTEE